MKTRARFNRLVLACAVAATSALGLGRLAGWVPSMMRSLDAGEVDGVIGGADFAMFWTAARLTSRGEWETVYSLEGFAEAMHAPLGAVSFAYPPPFAMALQPLSTLEYPTAFSVWLALSAASLAVGVLLGRRWGALGLLAMLFSVYVAIRFGQLVPIAVLFAVLSGWALEKDRPFAAGLLLGLLSLKPQFLIGPVIVMAATPSLRRSVLLGAATSGGSIFGVSALLAPEAWNAYLRGLSDVANPNVSTAWDFSIVALSRNLPLAASAVVTVVAVLGVVWLAIRSSGRTEDARQKVAIGLVLSLLLSPRVVNYDWTLLIPSIAWLAPAVSLDSPLVPAGALVALASLSGFIGVSWLAWPALAAFLATWSVEHRAASESVVTSG